MHTFLQLTILAILFIRPDHIYSGEDKSKNISLGFDAELINRKRDKQTRILLFNPQLFGRWRPYNYVEFEGGFWSGKAYGFVQEREPRRFFDVWSSTHALGFYYPVSQSYEVNTKIKHKRLIWYFAPKENIRNILIKETMFTVNITRKFEKWYREIFIGILYSNFNFSRPKVQGLHDADIRQSLIAPKFGLTILFLKIPKIRIEFFYLNGVNLNTEIEI